MNKSSLIVRKAILVLRLIAIPILVMALMGMGKCDANEFLILITAILADIVFYIVYKLFITKKTLP